MKKLLLILASVAITSIYQSRAQPNGGFEDWSFYATYERPDSWQTLNFLSLFTPPNPLSAFKATGVDKHSGNYALKLKTIFINNNPAPQQLPDTIGNVFTGKIILSPPSIKLGIPYTGRPSKMEFWSKYVPVGDDIGGVFVILQKWNGIGHDTIAYGAVQVFATASYTFFQIDLDYHSTDSPDTLAIGFASSYKKALARVGSALFIDDVALTGWVGIDESQMPTTNKVRLFPNPAKENVTIFAEIEEADNLQIIDVSGKLMGIYKVQSAGTNINTSVFEEGIYIYEIHDKKNNILTKGKFNVIK